MKINFELYPGQEASVYFDVREGNDAPCFYCGRPGSEQQIEVKEVVVNGVTLQKNTPSYRRAERLAFKYLLHRRAVCDNVDPCQDQLNNDRYHPDVDITS